MSTLNDGKYNSSFCYFNIFIQTVQCAWYDFLPTCSEVGKLSKAEQDRIFGILKDRVKVLPLSLAKDESEWSDSLKEMGLESQDRVTIKVGLKRLTGL